MPAKRKTQKADYAPLAWADAPDLLSTSQAARLAAAHLNTINKWLTGGKVPYIRVGTHRRVRKADLAAHLGLILDKNGCIAGDDDQLLREYAARFDAAIAKLRQVQDARGEALQDIQAIADEMRNEGRK